MPEQRGRQHHYERLGIALRDEISTIVAGELADPRVAAAFVTEVHLAPDGKSAHVFIAVHGDAEQERDAMAGLLSAKGFVRHEIAERLGLRHPPELTFEIDRSEQRGARIDQLLRRVAKRR